MQEWVNIFSFPQASSRSEYMDSSNILEQISKTHNKHDDEDEEIPKKSVLQALSCHGCV